MSLRPCIQCGEPTDGPRCPEHTTDTRIRKEKGQAAYDPVWRKLSLKARKMQPWCQDCNGTDDLTCDHIIPKTVAPELVHTIENLAVRCRSCNSRRGATTFTAAEAHAVLKRLTASQKRRPTKTGRLRVNAAQRAAQEPRGGTPTTSANTPTVRQSFSHTSELR